MKDGEMRIWMAGTECELRPVTAAEYIAAKREAEALEEKYGSDEETKKILVGACLAAKGVMAEGVRRFSSGEEVLSVLSANEILFAAAEYSINDSSARGSKAFEQEPAMTAKAWESAEEREYFSYKRDPFTGEVWTESGGDAEKIRTAAQTVTEPEESYLKITREDSTSDRVSLRRISDLIERDSRRYDGAYERY